MATRVIALTSVATNLSDPASVDVEGNRLNLEASPKVYFLSRSGGSMVFVGEGPVAPLAGHPIADAIDMGLTPIAGEFTWAWASGTATVVISDHPVV